MGIFSFFSNLNKKRIERAVVKNRKIIQNPKAVREERTAALEFFGRFKDPDIAVPALLKRFDYSLDHGINDTREKEAAMEGILNFKDQALSFVQDHLKQTTRIAWPIKIFQRLGSETQVITALESCLHLDEFDFDRDKIDKNYDILCYLRDYNLPDQGKKIVGMLNAHDERVRFAAAEVLIAQKSSDYALILEKFLTDSSAENTRLRQAAIEAFVEKGWKVTNASLIPGPFVAGYQLTKDRTLKRV